ncbi:MAG: phosphotransferase [Dehalococcoidia bacterium]|nr:phosphotransferase [Dehalococcoidia bacterium]
MAISMFPGTPAEVTPQWLTTALRTSGAIDRARVHGHDIRIIGEGSGFMGQLAQIALRYDAPEPGAPASLIAKFPAAAPGNRAIAMYFRFYEREVAFYREIARDLRLRTPRCYFHAFEPGTGDYLLLLEDLAPARVGDQLAGCTLGHARLALRELAAFQAAWWDSGELDALEWMPGADAEWNVAAAEQSYEAGWAPFCEFTSSYLTPEMRELGAGFGRRIRPLLHNLTADFPGTIVHGDYRLDNMFFASPGGGPEFAVIDWQLATKGGGVFDAAYFIAGTLPEEERAARERDLVRLYHDALVEHGVQGYSFERCWDDYRVSMLILLAYSVVTIGALDSANERGVELFTKISRRTLRAIEELRARELLP